MFYRLEICLTATLAAFAFWCVSAVAQTVVTACGADNASGGMNLATALASGGDIIVRCESGGTTIAITQTHVVRHPTSVDGEGRVTLDAGNSRHMFNLPDVSTRLVLRRMTVQNGDYPFIPPLGSRNPVGGIVSGRGEVQLRNVLTRSSVNPYDVQTLRAYDGCRFEDNTGGFVVRALQATFIQATFVGNTGSPLALSRQRSSGRPHAVFEGSEVSGNGRHIRWSGDLVLRRSRFTNNGSSESEGGAIHVQDGSVVVNRTDFVNNRGSSGGAVAIKGGRLEVRRATFEGNSAQGRGGALWVSSGEVQLRYAKFRENRAEDGGAVSLEGRLLGGAVLFARNSASRHGGAIDSPQGVIEIARGTFVDNTAGLAGGAIRSGPTGDDRVLLGNTLFARNKAPTGGAFNGRTLDLTNVSVVANQGGLDIVALSAGQTDQVGGVTLRNTLLSQNDGGNCVGDVAAVANAGENIQFPDPSCGANIPVADPTLDDMFVPLIGSPARVAGDAATCMQHPLVAGRDVYGSYRPANEKCTIGAVEHDLERHAVRLLAQRRELPDKIRDFFTFLGVLAKTGQ